MSSSNGTVRLSAAQLQAAHESRSNGHSAHDAAQATSSSSSSDFPALGGANSSNGAILTEDPFPVSSTSHDEQSAPEPKPKKNVDLGDESAFPSLGLGAATSKKPVASWGSGGSTAAARIKANNASSTLAPSPAPSSRAATPSQDEGTRSGNTYTTKLLLPTASITIQPLPRSSGPRGFSNAREAEPTSLGEVLALLMKHNPGVVVEASRGGGTTTVIVKAKGKDAEEVGEKVKRELLARLEKRTQEDVMVPEGLRALIIGAKGRTLKQITDSTGCAIQIPSRDPLSTPPSSDAVDEADTPLIPIALSGSTSAVAAAKAKILAIVGERISKARLEVADVKPSFWPFVQNKFGNASGEEGVSVQVPTKRENAWGLDVSQDQGEAESDSVAQDEQNDKIIVTGDREAATKVVEAIKAFASELESSSKTVTVSIPKSQHRFLVGSNADAILTQTGCSVELPSPSTKSEDITIRGGQAELVKALGLVMNLSSSTPLAVLDLSTAHRATPSVPLYSSLLIRYLIRSQLFLPIVRAHPTVAIYLTQPSSILNDGAKPHIEICGEGHEKARKEVIDVVRALRPEKLIGIDVDPLVQRIVRPSSAGKKSGKGKVSTIEEEFGVKIVWPKEGTSEATVVLVHTGEADAAASLESAKAALLEIVSSAADIHSSTLSVPAALHKHIKGQSGTTLNAILGEERLASVSFAGDDVVVRGPKSEVERVRKAIERIVEDAKNEDIVSSHVIEFEVDTAQVRHVVGKAGSGINKLREDLGVRVDFEELVAPIPSGGGKAKAAKSKVTIKGRKENAEEAKKRIISLVAKMADEAVLTIALPPSLDRGSLIGKQGAYLKRLENNYSVRINFPKDGRKDDDDVSSPARGNEVTIRGPTKGAEAAKKELVDLIAFSKEHGNVVTFTVSTKALPRILGKAGAQINAIKEETQVSSVDVDQESDEANVGTITVRGTKKGTEEAKKAILAIAKEVDDEARFTIEVPKEFHTTLIGSGGSSIRELIARCGGPTDARASGNTVRFPRQGEDANTVVITAPKAVAAAIKAALEKDVASLRSRITWGVRVPQSQHASVIGKGASALQELQRKHGVRIVMPGWNEYNTIGEVANKDDLTDVPEGDLVKLSGPEEAVKAAAAELAAKNVPRESAVKSTVQVPRKLHAAVAQNGRYFRTLPSGTRVTHGSVKRPSSKSKMAPSPPTENGGSAISSAPRIDDDGSNAEAEIGFVLVAMYNDEEEGADEDIPWIVESRTKEDGDKVVAEIEKLLAAAKAATHVGWVTVPRGLMPRIVGRGGSGLEQLRAGGVDVDVVGRRDANQLTITGTPDAIEQARQAIVAIAARPSRQARDHDDY